MRTRLHGTSLLLRTAAAELISSWGHPFPLHLGPRSTQVSSWGQPCPLVGSRMKRMWSLCRRCRRLRRSEFRWASRVWTRAQNLWCRWGSRTAKKTRNKDKSENTFYNSRSNHSKKKTIFLMTLLCILRVNEGSKYNMSTGLCENKYKIQVEATELSTNKIFASNSREWK